MKSISKIFKPNFVCLLRYKRYKHIEWDFHSVTYVMPLGWDLGVIGVKSLIFLNMAIWHIILKGIIVRTGYKYFLR